LPPRTLAGRRRDQLTKSPDYGAVLVAITVAQFYLSGMLQRTLPAGFIAPCLPTKTDRLPSGAQWLHEIKHDGFRIIARKSGGRVRLYSRPGNDFTRRFPLIAEPLERLHSRSCIIDGEAVACDDNGVASFDLVRHHRANDSVFLYAFDLIELPFFARARRGVRTARSAAVAFSAGGDGGRRSPEFLTAQFAHVVCGQPAIAE
jgi:ATP-dependent DNA ligase